ncbi:MAG TPA: hypothetical protein VMT57_02265, partial [Candidatus Thermoplasmatota archaeon]|nr:hypothetical protein [Candidatus Thermoplasmatota archaeon]
MKKIVAVILAMLLSVNVVLISKTVTADEPVFHDDFEAGSAAWTYVDGSLSFAGTQQSVVYEGTSSYKMTGTIDSNGAYAGNYQRGLYIPVIPGTEFTFAYMFPSKKVSYVGYILTFSNGKIGYYISLFSGNFVNISSVYLLQYAGESVNAWHAHTVDVYGNYKQAFGNVPQGLHITAVTMMMGDPYYTHKTQTAYFDDIRILIQGNCPPASDFTEDFETGSDGWSYFDGSIGSAGTQQSVVYEGISAYKMTGTIDSNGAYAGNYRQGLHIPVTSDTQFSFAYEFPNKKVAYVGYYLVFNTGKLGYYISKFNGNFINISTVYLLQYAGESVNTWHAHCANVYENYLKAFGSIPGGLYITGISMMMGDPYYSHNTQTAYFDGISIKKSEFSEDFETGSDGWAYIDGSLIYAGTQQSIVYEGASSYKMTGTIDSNGAYAGYYQHALNIPVTLGLKFNFAYEFPSRKVSYVGYILMFNTGKIGYYISLFSGNFVNISTVYLLQYKYETANIWHAHTADIYANYQQAFGGVPKGLCITGISMMMGDPYYSHNMQTAYFDGISIK